VSLISAPTAQPNLPPQVPTEGTLGEIAAAHTARVALAEEERARLVDIRDAAVTALADFDAVLATYREEAAVAVAATDGFRARVTAEGLDGLSVAEVEELLHLLDVRVPRATLQAQEVSGLVLVGLSEADMASVFKMITLGERRRLTAALRVGRHHRVPATAPTHTCMDWTPPSVGTANTPASLSAPM
jgi:hypothetical protein